MTDYTIYTQAGRACPWCDKAAALLDEKGLDYHRFPLVRDPLLALAAQHKHDTVPMIFHGETFIGGYSELVDYLKG